MVLDQENNAESSTESGCDRTSCNQIPRVYFVCNICRQGFETVEMFWVHKRRDHSEELKRIKVIIFDERFFKTEDDFNCDEMIFPPSPDPNLLNEDYLENAQSFTKTVAKDTLFISSETNFNIRTEDEKTDTTTTTDDDTVENCFDDEHNFTLKDACQRNTNEICLPFKRCKTDKNEKQRTNYTNTPSYSVTVNDLIQTVAYKTNTETNQSSKSDEQVQELEDSKFIVASIVKGSDGSEKVQFASTSTPDPDNEPEPEIKFIIETEDDEIKVSECFLNSSAGADVTTNDLQLPLTRKRIRSAKIKTNDGNRNSTRSGFVRRTIPSASVPEPFATLHRGHSGTNNSNNAINKTSLKEMTNNFQKQVRSSDGTIIVINYYFIQSETLLEISEQNPMTCKLCKTKLETLAGFKNHFENCYLHNKDRHIHCIRCNTNFEYPKQLTCHLLSAHSTTCENLPGRSTIIIDFNRLSTRIEIKNNTNCFDDNLPLRDWLVHRQKNFPDLILLDPDITQLDMLIHNPSIINYGVRCRLCNVRLYTEVDFKHHVAGCWPYNKINHRCCLQCTTSDWKLEFLLKHRREYHSEKSFPLPPFFCIECKLEFETQEELDHHENSLEEFEQNMWPDVVDRNKFDSSITRAGTPTATTSTSASTFRSTGTGTTGSIDDLSDNNSPRTITDKEAAIDWSILQRNRECPDPDPEGTANNTLLNPVLSSSDTSVDSYEISTQSSALCKICRQKLETEPDALNYDENWLLHNKSSHLFCMHPPRKSI